MSFFLWLHNYLWMPAYIITPVIFIIHTKIWKLQNLCKSLSSQVCCRGSMVKNSLPACLSSSPKYPARRLFPFCYLSQRDIFCLLVLYLPLFFVHKGFCSIGNNGTGLSFLLSETQILCPTLCAGIVLRVHVDGCEHVVMSAYLSPCQNSRSQSQSGGWGLRDENESRRGSVWTVSNIDSYVTRYYMKLRNCC